MARRAHNGCSDDAATMRALALASAAEMLWAAWQRGDDGVTSTRSRSTLWTSDRSVLVAYEECR